MSGKVIQDRARARTRVTKSCTVVLGDISAWTSLQIAQELSKLEKLKNDLDILDSKILDDIWDETKANNDATYDAELDVIETYQDKLNDSISKLKFLNKPGVVHSSGGAQPTKLKAPQAPLPKYSDACNISLHKFFIEFENVLSRFDHNDFEQYILLKGQISGKGLILLENMDVNSQSYTKAKALLLEALSNPTLQKFNLLSRLFNLNSEKTQDPVLFASEIRLIKDEILSQNIDMDCVMQFCFLRGMGENLKTHLVQITNTNFPSTTEIVDNLFKCIERINLKNLENPHNTKKFEKFKPSQPTQLKVESCAVKVTHDSHRDNRDKRFASSTCTLCTKAGKENGHGTFKCPVFKEPTQKLKFLSENSGCTLCAHFSHDTSSCKFKFRKNCVKCDLPHFSFLCNKQPKTDTSFVSNNQNNKAQKSVQNTSIYTYSFLSHNENKLANSILPTFTMSTLNNVKGRFMKDSGSEITFFTKKFVEKCEHIVHKDININVHGFNDIKNFDTQIVEIPFTLNSNVYYVRGVVVPEIHTNLLIPDLGIIAHAFNTHNLKLADEFIHSKSSVISDIDSILGIDYAYMIPEKIHMFGEPSSPSSYLETPIGNMLCGNINTLITNLKYLHGVSTSSALQYDNDCNSLAVSSYHIMVQEGGEVSELDLERAAADILDNQCTQILNVDQSKENEDYIEVNDYVNKFILDNIERTPEGRLIVPLPWNPKVAHRLGKNFNLAKSVLSANYKRLSKDRKLLQMTDQVIKDQLATGVIEKIPDFELFKSENPMYSFLAHMSVFKLDRDTTKCRVVFLSNICERSGAKISISHNQALYAGENLNKKLLISLTILRFDKFLLCFDLRKAFLQCQLLDIDSSRMLFLWFRNIEKNDFSLAFFKMVRLSFGLSCSPAILMLCLYKILILDTENDSEELKKLKCKMYNLAYMDNVGYSSSCERELLYAYNNVKNIFSPYNFDLQQFYTNSSLVQQNIDETPDSVNLLGMQWNRLEDTLTTKNMYLDPDASSKRLILKSIAKNYDLFNIYLPLLNEAKVFMQTLQVDKRVAWDDQLDDQKLGIWQKIAKKFNKVPKIYVDRFVGSRSDTYSLIACTDASKLIVGTCIYIQNVRTFETHFLMAKNKLVNKTLENKSIPSLELHALLVGAEVLIELYFEFCGTEVVDPINIANLKIYSDSLVALSWVNSYSNKLEKMRHKRTIFIMNRLEKLGKICNRKPIEFSFISGLQNPSDLTTRLVSYKTLRDSSYLTGDCFKSMELKHEISFVLPNPHDIDIFELLDVENTHTLVSENLNYEQLIPLDRYESFSKLVLVHVKIFQFINNLKIKIKLKNSEKFGHIKSYDLDFNFFMLCKLHIITTDQMRHFSDCFSYFKKKSKTFKEMPNIVKQMNIFLDQNILKVRSKCERGNIPGLCYFPILLHRNSTLTSKIIWEIHKVNSHVGKYQVLRELNREYFVSKKFSLVQKILKACIYCKRLNSRPIKLNASPYRDFRIMPPNIPYRFIFIDFFGHYFVRINGQKQKIWVLLISCLWCRSLNLKICTDLTIKTFLRALQLHIFDWGLPSAVFSDLGSTLVPASQIIRDFLKDPDTRNFLNRHNISGPKFEHYFKGNSTLGSLVEICVKKSKRLIASSIGRNVLNYQDFEFLVAQTISLANKRPVAFKEGLRDDNPSEDVPEVITPEILLRGTNFIDINIIPDLQSDLVANWENDPVGSIKDSYKKLQICRETLIKNYNEEFLSTLITQAVDKKDRYMRKTHLKLNVGDLVLLKEPLLKPPVYPLGIILKVFSNINDEVTHVLVRKGATKETVKRHVTQIIYLLSCSDPKSLDFPAGGPPGDPTVPLVRPVRQAA